MPENLVKVVFEADSSQLKKSFQQVNDELHNVSAKGTDASKAMAEGIQAVGIKAKESTEHLGIMGKAAEKGQEIVKDFGADLVKFSLGAVGVAAAFEMVKKAVETSMESETMHVRLTTIIGDSEKAEEAIGKVEKASDEMNTSQAKGLSAMQTLLTAGTPFEKTDYVIKGLEADVRLYGGSLEELTDIYARMQLKGDEGIISAREMNKLVQASGVAAREAAKEFAEMDHNLEINNALVEHNAVVQQRAWAVATEARSAARLVESQALSDAREVADRHTAAASIMAKATGEDKEGFKLFETKLSSGVATYQKPSESPLGREQAMAKQYEGGAKELAATSGYSRDEINQQIKSGAITPEMLLSENQKAVARERSDADKKLSRERNITDKMEVAAQKVYIQGTADYIEQAGKEEKIAKRGLAQTALQKAVDITPEKEAALAREEETKAGQLEKVTAGTEKVNEKVGNWITEFFDRLAFSFGAVNKHLQIDPETGMVTSKKLEGKEGAKAAGKGPVTVDQGQEMVGHLQAVHFILRDAFGGE